MSFNLMAAVTICSDFGALKNKFCCDLSIFVSNFVDLIFLPLFLDVSLNLSFFSDLGWSSLRHLSSSYRVSYL